MVVLILCVGCSAFQKNAERSIASQQTTLEPVALINKLHPFESDGCRKFSQHMNYPKMEKWGLCCVQHDISYWKGGRVEDKYAADQRLQNCMIEVGEPNIARLMYWGVRAPTSESSSRWGYGWTLSRGHAPYSEAEQLQVDTLEKQIPTDFEKIEVVSTEKLLRHRGSLTGDACVDASLSFIQNQLARKMSPLNVQSSVAERGEDNFEFSLSIMTKECHAPYKFTYTMKRKNSCVRAARERAVTKDIVLKDIDYPAECQ